jgi:hypothetical protein
LWGLSSGIRRSCRRRSRGHGSQAGKGNHHAIASLWEAVLNIGGDEAELPFRGEHKIGRTAEPGAGFQFRASREGHAGIRTDENEALLWVHELDHTQEVILLLRLGGFLLGLEGTPRHALAHKAATTKSQREQAAEGNAARSGGLHRRETSWGGELEKEKIESEGGNRNTTR